MSTSMTRRAFVSATTVGAAAVAASGAATVAFAEEAAPAEEDFASQVTETVDFDVVVAGSGPAGLTAGVQAAELGLKVLIVEASDIRGGMLIGAEGMAAVDSPWQIEQGIKIDVADVVEDEVIASKFHVNGLFWKNMLDRSPETMAWLIDKGVKFTGVVDDYYGSGVFPTFHWFEGDFACPTAFGDPMEAVFKGYEGCEIRLNTRARQLKMEDGKVAGLYATTPDGVLEINAKAVILATGGYSRNEEMVAEAFPALHAGRCLGFNPLGRVNGPATCVGDGRKMALEVGANDSSEHTAFMTPRSVCCNTENGMLQSLGGSSSGIWVNQDGFRFIREDCGAAYGVGAPLNAMLEQWETYVVIDAGIIEGLSARIPDALAALEAEVAGGEVFEAQTVEELAEYIGCKPENIAKTVADYNAGCEAGVDGFHKDPALLAPIATPPFFVLHQIYAPYHLMGAIVVNVNYEVVTKDHAPIPGLYAAGTEADRKSVV